jgi:zinc transporter, ZIP family
VFLSNLPEAIAATTGLTAGGWTRSRIMALWVLVTLVCGLASLAGYAVFDSAGPQALAFVLAFAAGAILTMLADTMMPEAFEHGGKQVGLATTLGFAVAFALSILD